MDVSEAKRIRAEAAGLIKAWDEYGWRDPYTGPPFVVVTEQVRDRHREAIRVLRGDATEVCSDHE